MVGGVVTVSSLTGCVTGAGSKSTPPPPISQARSHPPLARRQLPPLPPSIRRPHSGYEDRGVYAWKPPGGVSNRWNTIVIHHSAGDFGSAAHFDKYHRTVKNWDELGYHFVIGNGNGATDGLIEVGPRWLKQKHGAHCKTDGNYYNEHGIGICLVGNFESKRPTNAQIQSLKRLVRFLMRETGVRAEKIVSHGDVTGKTECPGRHFPLHWFRRSLDTYSAGVMR
jgi:hypothetical protein